ncbi:MAG: 4-hydroxy-tetrahydrodipicolinate reductase [Thermoleophilia bacterium]|nr:4-hydroxy-tetrahydrodipicolinate reductase [Thermoleophilia bacterium]
MMRVLVNGAAGRMGQAVVDAVRAAEGMEVAARVDPVLDAGDGRYPDLRSALADVTADAAVDFTRPDTVYANCVELLEAGVHAVVGTTGLTDDQLADLRARVEAGSANLLIAPNFSTGALLMMRFAAEASRHMEKAEIIELHHDRKLDAPSGTSLRTAGLMEGEVPIQSVRLPGLVAHQEVILGRAGEILTIRHDSLNRESFMPGVILALRAIAGRPGLTMGLEPVLFGDA